MRRLSGHAEATCHGFRCAASADNTLADFGIHLRAERDGTQRLPCPKCPASKRGPALSVRIKGDAFTFRCFRCEWSGSSYGVDVESVAAAFKPPDPGRAMAAMLELWRNSRPIEPDTVAASYLAARGCRPPDPEGDLRWHPALEHPCGHVGPVCGVDAHAVTGAPLSLHRTWITATGKADIACRASTGAACRSAMAS